MATEYYDPATDPFAFTLGDMENEAQEQKCFDKLWEYVDQLEPTEKAVIYMKYQLGASSDMIALTISKLTSNENITTDVVDLLEQSALEKLRNTNLKSLME